MRTFLPLLAVVAVAALAATACQPNTSNSGGGQPAPPPATSRGHGGGTGSTATNGPTSTDTGPLYNGPFDAVGGYQPGQRVDCDNINYPLMIKATGPLKWRAFATNTSGVGRRVINEVHATPSEGMLGSGQTTTINISGGITTIVPPPSYFEVMVEYVNMPGAGILFEFDCQGR